MEESDWIIQCSNDKCDQRSGIYEPPPDEIESLYFILNELPEIKFQSTGYRPLTPSNVPITPAKEEPLAEEKSNFDFMDEMSSPKLPVRRQSKGALKSSAKKKTTSLDGVLSNIKRPRRIETTMPDMPLLGDEEEIPTEMNVDICRICLLDGKLKDTNTDQFKNVPIKEMLEHIHFIIFPNIPNKICNNCLNFLWNTYNFVQILDRSTQHSSKMNQKYYFPNLKTENNLENCENANIKEIKYKIKKETSCQKKKNMCSSTENNSIFKLNEMEKNKRLTILLKNLTRKDITKAKKDLKKESKINLKLANKKIKEDLPDLDLNSPENVKKRLETVLKCANPCLSKVEINEELKLEKTPNLKKIRTEIKRSMLNLHKCDREIKVKLVFEEKTIKCQRCNQLFPNLHLYIKHRCFLFICDICRLSFTTKYTLKKHKESEHNIMRVKPTFQCEFCDKTYCYPQNLKRHSQKTHNFFK